LNNSNKGRISKLMKKTVAILLILLFILLVACQDAAPEATAVPEPTVAAEDLPAEEASPEESEETAEVTEAPEPIELPTEMPAEETAPEPTPEVESAEVDSEEEPMDDVAEADDTTIDITDEQLEMMAALAPPPQLSDKELGIQTVPCFPTISPGANEIEGEDYTCGVLTVPQNWDAPDGRNLDLAFLVVKATGENPQPDPLIRLEGGPGASAVLTGGMDKYKGLQSDRDIIFFDIRGAGLSQRLSYDECLVLALQNGAPADQVAFLQSVAANLIGLASSGVGTSPVPFYELDLPVLNEICWEQFTAQGIDPNQFTTAANARDVVELIKALGYESFNIDSVSYGTRLAMTIMNNITGYDAAPELRSVVLDSTFPPSVYLVRTIVRSNHDFMLQLLAECEADAACNEAYPDLGQRLATLLNQLEEAPLTTNGETVTLEDVVTQLTGVENSTRAAYIPKMIAELETGVLDTYFALRDGEVGTDSPEALPVVAEDLDINDPVQAFVAAALDLLSPEEASLFPTYIQFLMAEEDPLAVLPEFIAETYSGETADQMLALAENLTAEDFANSSYGSQIQAEAAAAEDPEMQLANRRGGIAGGLPLFLYNSVHCADDILHESIEDAQNSYNALAFPQLTDLVESQGMANRCENWLVEPQPIEVKDPVSSNVPALILQGAYDGPTPIYMGQTANSELENSTFVLIPQQGHGTWTSAGSCVGQIATAFLLDPETELDLSCLEARQPQWVLPGDGGS
jgi:pimeloyl-ACP methyl ester carboxylesterase